MRFSELQPGDLLDSTRHFSRTGVSMSALVVSSGPSLIICLVFDENIQVINWPVPPDLHVEDSGWRLHRVVR